VRLDIRIPGWGIDIRPFVEADVPAFVEAVRESATSVGLWMPWCEEEYTERQAQAWFAYCAENISQDRAYDLGIFSAEDNALCGGIAINQINPKHRFGVIGYWVRQSRQRQGIATAAVRAIATFGFDALGLTRLEIIIAEANQASRGVADKVGAVYEGIARNRLVIRAHALDAAMYSLIPA
jgi:RimJ/RimL family protein N-acetyltransferase